MPLHFLFIDFNSFFSSVEQQLRPELRGKPVGVVPMMAESTSCIAASYEAKKFGVKTGTVVKDAKRLCPDIQFVEARHTLYIEYHHRLHEAVESCIPVHSVHSIDEMACELTGTQQQPENAKAMAFQIKSTIAQNVGAELHCSIGIAPNLYLSKTATDMQKPDGLVVIDIPDLPECLFKLALNDLCGIGRKMEQRLHRYDIRTVKDLWNADKALLRKAWGGIEGERMYAKLRGDMIYAPPTHRSSVGHSHVLPPALRTEASAYAVINRLVQKAAMRLRNYGYVAGSMHIGVKYLNYVRWSEEISFDDTQDTVDFLKALAKLWDKKPTIPSFPLAVVVTLFNLSEAEHRTPSLFDTGTSTALNKAIDKLNTRYGKNTIYFGGAFSALEAAPTRIAFTHIPDYK